MATSPGNLKLSRHLPSSPQTDRALLGPRGFEAAGVTDISLRSDALESRETTNIRRQLDHMLQGRVFAQSEKLSRFLRFIVEHVLRGHQSFLKEYVIGTEVYDRKPPYHPTQDSIVRTEARRLRSKLKEYYETEGEQDPVYVCLLPGKYIPVFHFREALAGNRGVAQADSAGVSEKALDVAIAVLPFTDISGSSLSSKYARGIPDELVYTLLRMGGCRVISPSFVGHLLGQVPDVAALMRKVGADIALEGSARVEGNNIRITVSAVDANGFQWWAKRVDVDAGLQTHFTIEERIAAALSSGFSSVWRAFERRRLPWGQFGKGLSRSYGD